MTSEAERESLVGRQLGGYEFLSLIDEGGMGQVYRARDLALPRDVAVKVVSPEFTHDAVRRTRFRQEAEVLAAFAHPHIAHIYAFVEAEGRFLLAMELVPGESLAERIARGPVRVSDALHIASQVADALDAAHEQGVIHRDLKPANVRITPDGVVKVLDFGLATSGRPALADGGTTITRSAPGTLLGTIAYMSPEQARGEQVDKRTDIWAFGCVLFEMLTGQRLFQGEGATDTLARLFTQDPDWSALPPQVPPAIRALLKRCLERDRVKRLGDVAAIRFALDDVAGVNEHPAATTSSDASSRSGITRWRTAAVSAAVTAAVLIVAAAIGLAVWESEPSSPQHWAVPLPQGHHLAGLATGKPILAISPGDRYIAFVVTAQGEAERQIYLHSRDNGTAEPVPGSVGAHTPFFSPDEAWLGFFSRQGTLLKIRIPVKGGIAESLTDIANPFGASWGEHRIVLTFLGSALQELPDTGGPPQALTRLRPGENMHLWPHLLPGGTATLFGVASVTSTIVVQRLGSDERRDLIQEPGISTPQFSPSGHVVYAQAGNLKAIPFDPQRETTDGAVPTLVMSGILQHAGGAAHFSVSANGSVAYVPGDFKRREFKLVRVSRNGTEERTFAAPPRRYSQPRLAPDGNRVAVDVVEGSLQVWLYDLAADAPIPFTYDTEGDNRHATWAGLKRLVFQSARKKGARQLFSQSVDRGALEQLTHFPPDEAGNDLFSYPVSYCRDGLLTFVRLVPKTEAWVMHLGDSGRGRKNELLDFPMSADGSPQLSPDCQRLAYISDESGRREVWVRDFPGLGNRHQISTGGGTEPVWNPNPTSRELLYRNGDDMMAVKIGAQGSVEGKAEKLFTAPYAATQDAYSRPNYDVFPDGSFLMLKRVEQEQPLTQINVVLNWSEGLKRGR